MTPLLTDAAAQAIVHRAFPGCTETITDITTLPSSFFNTNFLLTLSSGSKYVLKVSPSPAAVRVLHNDISIHSEEAALLPRLSTLPLPTPKLHLHDDSLQFLPAPFLFLSHLPGTAGASSSLMVEETHSQLSQLLLAPPPKEKKKVFFGRITGPPFTSWRQYFSGILEAALRDGEDMALLLPYSSIRASLLRLGGALDAITAPQLVVVDFGPASILTDDGVVTGVIGFERAMWGDPRLARFYRDAPEGEMGVRDLLYAVYHAVVGILETFYYGGGTEVEMEERRRLVMALRKLEEVDALPPPVA